MSPFDSAANQIELADFPREAMHLSAKICVYYDLRESAGNVFIFFDETNLSFTTGSTTGDGILRVTLLSIPS